MKCFIVNKKYAEHPSKDDAGFICISNNCDIDYAKHITNQLECNTEIKAFGGTKNIPGHIYILCS